MRDFYICPVCGRKYYSDQIKPETLLQKRIGICQKCASSLPYTDGNGCFEGTRHISYIISSFYYTKKIRSAIRKYKFYNNRIFAEIFSYFLIKTLSQFEHIKNFDIIVPLPLSKKRMLERGYNQSALVAGKVAEHFNIAYSENILYRSRNTEKQSLLHGISRVRNVLGAFCSDSDLTGMKILIFDDVFSSGNTIDQAAKALRDAGAADVVGVTIALPQK